MAQARRSRRVEEPEERQTRQGEEEVRRIERLRERAREEGLPVPERGIPERQTQAKRAPEDRAERLERRMEVSEEEDSSRDDVVKKEEREEKERSEPEKGISARFHALHVIGLRSAVRIRRAGALLRAASDPTPGSTASPPRCSRGGECW